jgi:hypothetical protein
MDKKRTRPMYTPECRVCKSMTYEFNTIANHYLCNAHTPYAYAVRAYDNQDGYADMTIQDFIDKIHEPETK